MKIKWWWYLFPFLILQLPFAFSDMCLWDSAVQQHLYDSNNFECAKKLFFDSGVPLSYYEMKWLAMLPNYLFFFKFFSILTFFLGSLSLAYILRLFSSFSEFEIYFISVLTFFYPSYAMWQHFIMFPYYISLLAFLGGVICFLHYKESKKIVWAIGAFVLLIIAFNIQSFLLFSLGLMALNYFYQNPKTENFLKKIILFLKANWFFVALPFLYYLAISIFFPRAGFYKEDGYNTLSANFEIIGTALAKSLVNISVTPILEALKYFKSDIISSAVYLTIALILALFLAKKIRVLNSGSNYKKLILGAFVLLIAALLPYSMVGKHVSTHGYETRHSLLAHTPALILLIVVFRFFKTYQKVAAWVFFSFCFFMFLKTQIHWENRYQKYMAIEKTLKQTPEEQMGDIVFFTEENHLWAMNDYLRFYECNMLLMDTWNNQNHLGINDEREKHSSELAQSYIDKYLKYKDCLFFNSFKPEMRITEVNILEQPEDDAILFMNGFFEKDKARYYSQFINVTVK